MELEHLDDRKLLIKTAPGDIIKPMLQNFDPLAAGDGKTEWEVMEDCDCPSMDNVAQADTTDVDILKKACETELKRKGIDVGAFIVDGQRAYFKQCTREEALAAKQMRKGHTMYIVSDPDVRRSDRVMKAVKDEGMPTFKNPFVHGNMFLLLTINFPETLEPLAQAEIKKLLPPPRSTCMQKEDDPDVELHSLVDVDPVQSYNSNKVNMTAGGEAYDDEDDEGGGGGQRMPGGCQQQ